MLATEKDRLERTVAELKELVDRKHPVETAATRLLTIQVEEPNNQCQFLAKEHSRLEQHTHSLSD